MWKFFIVILQILLYCNTLQCYILRLSCKQTANFNITRDGYVLQGYVIKSIGGLTDMECRLECMLNNECSSINMEKEDETCELNSKSTIHLSAGENALVRKPNWIYKATDYSSTLVGGNCQNQRPCKIGEVCMDTCTCPGYECLPGLKNCKEAQDRGYRASGVYQISNSRFPSHWLPVFCDLATDGGGWIVFQRRVDNSVDFYRNWNEYKKGFGEITGNYWLGLDNLHTLAAPGKGAVLRVDLKHRDDNNKVYAYYSTFEIGNEADGYRLKIGGYTGTAGDSLSYHDGMKFTTKDRDNDLFRGNCAVHCTSAWWYKICYDSNLNGRYSPSGITYVYISWKGIKNTYGGIVFSEMKLRHYAKQKK